DTVGIDRSIRVKLGKLRDERIAHLIVRVETENPMRDDLCLLDRITPLFRMRIKPPFEYAHVRKSGKDSERSICAIAVNYDDVLRPTEPGQRAADILFLIVRQ